MNNYQQFLNQYNPSGFFNEGVRPNQKSAYENTLPWYVAQENAQNNYVQNNLNAAKFNQQVLNDRYNQGMDSQRFDFDRYMGEGQLGLSYNDQALNAWNLGQGAQQGWASLGLQGQNQTNNYNLGLMGIENQRTGLQNEMFGLDTQRMGMQGGLTNDRTRIQNDTLLVCRVCRTSPTSAGGIST